MNVSFIQVLELAPFMEARMKGNDPGNDPAITAEMPDITKPQFVDGKSYVTTTNPIVVAA